MDKALLYHKLRLTAFDWENSGKCWCKGHFDDHGKAKSDDNVCQRERTWRAYVRARDEYLLLVPHLVAPIKPSLKEVMDDLSDEHE